MTLGELLHKAQHAQGTGNATEAERLYRAAVSQAPSDAQVHRMLGVFLLEHGALVESESHIAEAVKLAPDQPYMHQNHALVLSELKRFDEAVTAATRAIKLDENYALAYFNRANALAQSGQLAQALRDYERAETRGLKDPLLYFAMGHTLTALGQRTEALTAYERAISLNPNFMEAIVNRGVLLADLQRPAEALMAFDRALALNPNNPVIFNMRGMALFQLKRIDEAADNYKKAIALAPDYAKAYYNIGLLLLEIRLYDKALPALDRAAMLDPSLPWIDGHRMEMHLQLADWSGYDARLSALLARVDNGDRVAQPFHLTFMPASLAQQRKATEIFSSDKCPPQNPLAAKKRAPGRLRVAYLSKDFYNHATAVLFTDVLGQHDRAEVEVFGISYGVNDQSPERARIVATFEHFQDMRDADDRQIAARVRELNIDIAIDVDGHTKDSRPAILSWRPAPVQAQFLGFPGTMGAAHIDYILSDAVVTPPEDAPFYTEKFALLPGTYQPNGTRPQGPEVTRADIGLPETGFVFGCFNNIFKVTPKAFDSWMRILHRVPDSMLWLFAANETVIGNLRQEAQTRGIDPARLFFAATQPLAQHLARTRHMDLFLDTFTYGAHTTASDALSCNVPLVTLKGDTFAGRVASSLLTTIGLPELITESVEDYENLAVALANDTVRQANLKNALRQNRDRLFNAPRFARHLEAAYRQMQAKHEAKEAPESFAVEP